MGRKARRLENLGRVAEAGLINRFAPCPPPGAAAAEKRQDGKRNPSHIGKLLSRKASLEPSNISVGPLCLRLRHCGLRIQSGQLRTRFTKSHEAFPQIGTESHLIVLAQCNSQALDSISSRIVANRKLDALARRP